MRLRVFRAARMAEAMAECRQVLGPDALILSTRRTATGVEVTAALEPAEEPPPLPPPLPAVPDLLARHNIPAPLRAQIGNGQAEAVARALRFGTLPDGMERPLALIGPPGAGKTLSCAKLATRMVLNRAAPLVVTADSQRAGAVEQIAAFTRVLGVTLAMAGTGAQLASALARRKAGQPMLLDTAGCDPFDPAQAEQLLALLRVTDAAPVLVLPAGLDAEEAAETARAFAALGARHMLPTRLDGARRLGGVLAAAFAGPLTLTEAGTGSGAADGLTPLTPAWLAERLHGLARPAQEAA
ncbi:GTP-binding protein [Roseomonas xinghualingensis]|uniref:flagellar biosynthesis protein FlhF n=1 Tax=Roseomonas xinghualingensis TaxID=2986475 RepID=UPI0021F148B4|nr:GTP-binding protein [Roseomonas sp. SXEYE001]MCV4207523.1 GTP-binding protein [Roseomonas sp. SXEYE001]